MADLTITKIKVGQNTYDVIDSSALHSHQDISGKLDKSGGTMTGNLSVGSAVIGTNGYLQGTWLQTTAATAVNDSNQIAVIGNG